MMGSDLTGRFHILNNDAIQTRANREDDPRHVFYAAMLSSRTYNDYLARVGSVTVQPETTAYAVTGEMEIRYCRNKRGWIADA